MDKSDESRDDFDASRADLLEAIVHPTRIKILQELSGEPKGFAQLKRAVGIQSSGHLSFHLGKLRHLITTDVNGNYVITENGRQALWSADMITEHAIKSISVPKIVRSARRQWAALAVVMVMLVALGGVTAYQQQQIGGLNNKLGGSTTTSVLQGNIHAFAPSEGYLRVVAENALEDNSGTGDNANYIYGIRVTNLDNQSHQIGWSEFGLVTNTSSSYFSYPPWSGVPGYRTAIGGSMNPGENASGQIAFQIPANEAPSRITLTVPHQNCLSATNCPPYDISDVFFADVPENHSWVVHIHGVSMLTAVPNFANHSFFLKEYKVGATITNSTYVFYSGETVRVKFSLVPLNSTSQNMNVTEISAEDGFEVLALSQTLPATAGGQLGEVDIYVDLRVPASIGSFGYSMMLDVTLIWVD